MEAPLQRVHGVVEDDGEGVPLGGDLVPLVLEQQVAQRGVVQLQRQVHHASVPLPQLRAAGNVRHHEGDGALNGRRWCCEAGCRVLGLAICGGTARFFRDEKVDQLQMARLC
jgi:hypothetical protein